MKSYRQFILPVLLALAAVAAASCSKALNHWVYLRVEVSDFPSPADSLAGLKMAQHFENSVYQSQRVSPYAFLYDRPAVMDELVQAADTYYDSVKDTVTMHYTLTLKKVLSTIAPEEKDKLKVSLSSYKFPVQ